VPHQHITRPILHDLPPLHRDDPVRTAASLTAFAAEQGVSLSYATRLMWDTRVPTGWQEQRQALGFV
jgi:hypothetical protein